MLAVFNRHTFTSKTDKAAEENGLENGSAKVFICEDLEIAEKLINGLCNEIVHVANTLIEQSDVKNFDLKVQDSPGYAMVRYETVEFVYKETWETISVAVIDSETNILFDSNADIEFARQRAGIECYLSVFCK